MNKQTVVFDFDGVIHSYKSGWQGDAVIPDEPVIGIDKALRDICNAGYNIVVVSSRCNSKSGMVAVNDWMLKYDLLKYVNLITNTKPPAIVYIDDRGICFDGHPEKLLRKIQKFKPWYKR